MPAGKGGAVTCRCICDSQLPRTPPACSPGPAARVRWGLQHTAQSALTQMAWREVERALPRFIQTGQ